MEKVYCKLIADKYLYMYDRGQFTRNKIIEIFREYANLKQMEIDLRSELTEYDMVSFYKDFDKAREIVLYIAKKCKEIESRNRGYLVCDYDWVIEDF